MGGDAGAMIFTFFAVVLTGVAQAGEPGVFENYFDDSIKEVDISLDVAIKACLQNGDTLADKVKAAYKDCFGNDYDFDELASNEGSDSDGDGLPDSFEGNEACFYKKMGWVAGDAVAADVIKADLVGLESGMKSEFDGNIDKCAGWNGSFGARRKREAGETDTEVADVPSVMESGSRALSWLRSAVRKTRSAEPDKGKNNEENGNGKKGKGKDNGKGAGKPGNSKKGKGSRNGAGNRNGKKGKGKDKGKGVGRTSKGKKGKGAKGGRKGKGTKGGRKNTKDKKSKGKGKGAGNPGNGKKGKGTGRTSKGKKGKGTKEGRKGKGAKGGRKNSKDKKDKDKGKGAGKETKTEENKNKGRSKKSMDESTYNKLWCFDLSLEQVLEKCVEEKIKN